MRAIPAFLLVLLGATQAAAPAHAKCDYADLADRLREPEVVFQGRLIQMSQILVDRKVVDDYIHEGPTSTAWLGEFRVERVWRGSVGSTISVLTEPSGCGKPFGGVGHSWVVAANRVGPYLVAHGCQGIQPGEESAALALLGAPAKTYAADATQDLMRPAETDRRCGSASTAAGIGFFAGMAVASLIAAWTARRRSRR